VKLRLVALVVAAAAVAGCGGASSGDASGTVTLWVTRDRGAHVLVDARVDAGQTALQALDRKADLETRYGGRYVQSVDGLSGSLGRRVDWFYFVNGIEADRSAAEYRLRPGDVVWFDYRAWRGRMSQPVVVGAFPEPFVHGFGGKRRAAVVQYGSGFRAVARQLAARIGGRAVACCRRVDPELNLLVVRRPRRSGSEVFRAERRSAGGADAPVRFVLAAAPERVDDVVHAARRRYAWTGS